MELLHDTVKVSLQSSYCKALSEKALKWYLMPPFILMGVKGILPMLSFLVSIHVF